MAVKCPKCSSADTQAGIHLNQCLRCGQQFDFQGKLSDGGQDDSTREALLSRMAPRKQVVMGNYADVQRWGAEAAVAGGGGGVALPNQDTPHGIATQAQVDAERGETNVETERVAAPKTKARK